MFLCHFLRAHISNWRGPCKNRSIAGKTVHIQSPGVGPGVGVWVVDGCVGGKIFLKKSALTYSCEIMN